MPTKCSTADVVVGEVDENQFADVLADFIWQHRQELAKLLADKPTTNERGR